MGQPQFIEEPFRKKNSKKFNDYKTTFFSKAKMDAYSKVSQFQKAEDKRDLLYSYIALVMKSGLLILVVSSFVHLGLASHQRVQRKVELYSLLAKESEKLQRLRESFDQLFTIGGSNRFFKNQDQWIAPNSVRVIWR